MSDIETQGDGHGQDLRARHASGAGEELASSEEFRAWLRRA